MDHPSLDESFSVPSVVLFIAQQVVLSFKSEGKRVGVIILIIPLLPSGKTQLMECDALGVVGQAGFAKNK